MHSFYKSWLVTAIFAVAVVLSVGAANAQSGGTSSGISGTVLDPSGAVVANATVEIHNAVSGFDRTTTTDSKGNFSFPNVPFNPYHMTVTAAGFAPSAQDVEIRSALGVNVRVNLAVAGSSEAVTVEAGEDLVENDPIGHTDVDRGLFDKIPLESQSSSVSSLVTLAAPGVAADSNGLFHGLGDHASNSFSVDNQPITDQQSKIFSNQIPVDSIQSLEVIPGAPPAEYGGKTSLIINVTTRSGQGSTTPHGSVTGSYGSFGSATAGFDLGYGGKNWGNFVEIDGLNSGRFLDGPEFSVFHDKGNELNFFDRIARSFTPKDSVHLNLNYTRSWFQTPNTFDNLNVPNVVSGGSGSSPVFDNVGNTDQRAKIETYDIAPLYTHVVGSNAIFNFGGFVRRDAFNYYPSNNPLADLGPIQSQTISQNRTLLNAGVRSDYSIQTGRHNIKIGALYQQTFLRERDQLGLINSTSNSHCVDDNGSALPCFTDISRCAAAGALSNDPSVGGTFNPVLLPSDFSRGGTHFNYFGHTDVKELALYIT